MMMMGCFLFFLPRCSRTRESAPDEAIGKMRVWERR